MDNSRVGIIVLNWNGLKDTRDCLQSLFALPQSSLTIYVVDNGSQDGSATALQTEFGSKITLIANSENLLYSGGNNVGIRRALADNCSHILLLNNDTTVHARLITELLSAQSRFGDGIYCPKIYYSANPTVIWYAGGILSLRRARSAHRGIREVDHGQYEAIEETEWATGCALFATRSVFENVGLLDEDFKLYSEDLDFCLRAKDKGYKIIYVPHAMLWHKVSASVGGNYSSAKLRRKWRSLRQLLRKHLPNPVSRMIALTDFLITEPLRLLLHALRGRLR